MSNLLQQAPKRSLLDKWVTWNEPLLVLKRNGVLTFAITWIDFEDIMLNKKRSTQYDSISC